MYQRSIDNNNTNKNLKLLVYFFFNFYVFFTYLLEVSNYLFTNLDEDFSKNKLINVRQHTCKLRG